MWVLPELLLNLIILLARVVALAEAAEAGMVLAEAAEAVVVALVLREVLLPFMHGI